MGSTHSNEKDIVGYQIERVYKNSPGEKAKLCPYFDFIVALDGDNVQNENYTFLQEYITKSINQPLKVTVFSTKDMDYRDALIIPSNTWNKENEEEGGALGCKVRYEYVTKALECVWHVVAVEKDSPSEQAGLQPEDDYIIGYNDSLFNEINDFHQYLDSDETLVNLFVYNNASNSFRNVIVDRSKTRKLGMEVANGFVHRIPTSSKRVIGEDRVSKQMIPKKISVEPVEIETQTMDSLVVPNPSIHVPSTTKEGELIEMNEPICTDKITNESIQPSTLYYSNN